MKKPLLFLSIFLLHFFLWLQSCHLAMDYDYALYVRNNSSHAIRVYLNQDEDYLALYPDTVLSDFEDRISAEIKAGEKKWISGGDITWEIIYKDRAPFDTMSLFVFHVDTLAKYDWNIISQDYNILKRYDLSVGDLEHLDFVINYPPSPGMEDMKMYP